MPPERLWCAAACAWSGIMRWRPAPVVHAEATGKVRRNMPDPVPMALLGRLAVDSSAKGFGVGAGLLQDALLRVWQASELLGVRGVVVDALDDSAARFYQHFGFRPSAALPLKLMITLEEVRRIIGQPGA